MSAHSPAPWESYGYDVYARGDFETPVGRVFLERLPLEEAEANLLLLAAAPELLAALNAISIAMPPLADPETPGDIGVRLDTVVITVAQVRAARAAITKAGG